MNHLVSQGNTPKKHIVATYPLAVRKSYPKKSMECGWVSPTEWRAMNVLVIM